MTIDTTDVELYLKKQAICGRMKFTNFMESTFMVYMNVIAILFILLYAIWYGLCHISADISNDLAGLMSSLSYVLVGFVCYLILIAMFFAGRLPRYNAMLSVEEIKNLYELFGREYDEMSYPPTNGRSAIEYLNTVITSGVLMDVTHSKRAQKLLSKDAQADVIRERSASAASELSKASYLITATTQCQSNDKENIGEVSGKIALVNKKQI